MAANWKILVENYHECYHCSSIHPELCEVSPPKSGEDHGALGDLVRRLHGARGSRRDDVADRRELAWLPHLTALQEREVPFTALPGASL